jgi:recombination protein RecR
MIYQLPQAITRIINNFERLPGIGPKSATRLAYYLMSYPQKELEEFATSIMNLKSSIKLCSQCHLISETPLCNICNSSERDPQTILVVEQPLDVISFERIGEYNGHYHVLHGVIAPLRHIGPDEIMIDSLLKRITKLKDSEIILAMNNTLEGETTALYIVRAIKNMTGCNVKVTRLAKGLPVGGEVEFADEITLKRSLENRISL